jgi:threonine dehydratase
MMTVSDAEIIAAMRLVWERMKIVVEPTGALGVAAALKRGAEAGRTIGVVVSGGNVDLGQIGMIFSA